MKVSTDVLQVLGNATILDNTLKLNGQLNRALYTKVNKVLEAAGGKWNRKTQLHLFNVDVFELIDNILNTGDITVPKDYGFFQTKHEIVLDMIDEADLFDGCSICEPSAGHGNIAVPLKNLGYDVHCIELLEDNVKVLRDKGLAVNHGDFMEISDDMIVGRISFDRILMNPPFSKKQDIKHVTRAFRLLNSSGVLVAIMSAGTKFRNDAMTTEFRQLVEKHGFIKDLPENSFKEAGTAVNTIMVVLRK